jgi:hypothetical protein
MTGEARAKETTWGSRAGVVLLAVPVLGILMGGIYAIPAMKISKEKDPLLTLLLTIGLGITVFGIGALMRMPPSSSLGAFGVSVALLLAARHAFGGLGHSLERFGVVHVTAIMLTVTTALL